jgi:hypothetical protein
MSGVYVVVLVFLVVALMALVAVWYFARRMKNDLDAPSGAVAGVRASLQLTPDSARRLNELSAEPILLKQGEEGVRVQIEHRPMLPLMAFVGKGEVSAALNEAAVRVSEQWGPRWVVLLTSRDDGTVSAQRLS